jgi:aminoglycoside phosphotransferase (APT) family kinase protein
VPTWDAEVVVGEALAAQLVARFPETAGRPLRLLSTGWDRTAWLVDERWVFGFPRRAVVVPGLERELEWLPQLAPHLPAPIPVPRFVGAPSDAFPWPFFGGDFLPGVEAVHAPLDNDGRTAVGVELATFLRVLHSPELAAELGADALPPDGNDRANMQVRVPYTRERLQEIDALSPAAARVLDEAARLPPAGTPATIAHGDLHARQLLVHDGRLSGVIDWIDLCRGDPSIDLLLLWSLVPPSGRGDFLRAYGSVDDACLLRARVIALMIGAVLAQYAHDQGDVTLEREARASIERALED